MYSPTSYGTQFLQAENQRLNALLQELQSQIGREESLRLGLANECEELRTNVAAVERERSEVSSLLRSRQSEIDRLLDELDSHVSTEDALRQEVSLAHADRDAFAQAYEKIQAQLSSANLQSQEQTRETQGMVRESQELRSQLKDKQTEVDTLKRFQGEYEKRVNQLVAVKDTRIRELEVSLDNHEAKELDADKYFGQIIKEKDSEIADLALQLASKTSGAARKAELPAGAVRSDVEASAIGELEKRVLILRKELELKDEELQDAKTRVAEFTRGLSPDDALFRAMKLEKQLKQRTEELATSRHELSQQLADAEQLFLENKWLRKHANLPAEQLIDLTSLKLAQSVQQSEASAKLRALERLQVDWDEERTRLRRRIVDLAGAVAGKGVAFQGLDSDKIALANRFADMLRHHTGPVPAEEIFEKVGFELIRETELTKLRLRLKELDAQVSARPQYDEIAKLTAENQALKWALETARPNLRDSQQYVQAASPNWSPLNTAGDATIAEIKKSLADVAAIATGSQATRKSAPILGIASYFNLYVESQPSSSSKFFAGAPDHDHDHRSAEQSSGVPAIQRPQSSMRDPSGSGVPGDLPTPIGGLPRGMPEAAYSHVLGQAVPIPEALTLPVASACLAEALFALQSSSAREAELRRELIESHDALQSAANKFQIALEERCKAEEELVATKNLLTEAHRRSADRAETAEVPSERKLAKLGAGEGLEDVQTRLALAEGDQQRLEREVSQLREQRDILRSAYECLEIDSLDRERFLRERNAELAQFQALAVESLERTKRRLEEGVAKELHESVKLKAQELEKKLRVFESVAEEATGLIDGEDPRYVAERWKAAERNFRLAKIDVERLSNELKQAKQSLEAGLKVDEGEALAKREDARVYELQEQLALAIRQCDEFRRILARRRTAEPVPSAIVFWNTQKERELDITREELARVRREVLSVTRRLREDFLAVHGSDAVSEGMDETLTRGREREFERSVAHSTTRPREEVVPAMQDVSQKPKQRNSRVPSVPVAVEVPPQRRILSLQQTRSVMLGSRALDQLKADFESKLAAASERAFQQGRTEAESELSSQVKDYGDAKRDVMKLKGEVERLKARLKALEAEKTVLTDQLKQVDEAMPLAEFSADAYNEMRQRLEGEVLKLKRHIAIDLKFELEGERLKLDHLRDEARRMSAELDEHRKRELLTTAPAGAPESEMVKLSVQLKLKQDEIDKYIKAVRNLEKEQLKLRSRLLEQEFDKAATSGFRTHATTDGLGAQTNEVPSEPVAAEKRSSSPQVGDKRPKNVEAIYELEKVILQLRSENKKLCEQLGKAAQRPTSSKAALREVNATHKDKAELVAAQVKVSELAKQLEDANKKLKMDKELMKEAEKILDAVDGTEKKYAAALKENEQLKRDIAALNDDKFWEDLDTLQQRNRQLKDAVDIWRPIVLEYAPNLVEEIDSVYQSN